MCRTVKRRSVVGGGERGGGVRDLEMRRSEVVEHEGKVRVGDVVMT